MFGWFKSRKVKSHDLRNWNEDWQIGDVAECIRDDWHRDTPPWSRPRIGQRFIVVGFTDDFADYTGNRHYFLHFKDCKIAWSCTAFRKVYPDSKIVEQIMSATPGRDIVREPETLSVEQTPFEKSIEDIVKV